MGALLVTGCTGLLGANICFGFRHQAQVVGISRSPLFMENVEHVPLSFEDAGAVGRLIEERGVSRVIHCAAVTNVDACERHPEYAMRVNCDAAVRLARAAVSHGASFTFISSDAVFSGARDGCYTEDDETCPVNVYGRTKALAEEGILALCRTLVVRTNLYGMNYQRKASLGEWVVDTLSAGKAMTMFDDVWFSPLVADTLSLAIADAMDAGASGVLNLSSTGGITKYDFGMAIKERLELGGSINAASVDDFDFAARRPHNMCLDNSKAYLLLNRRLPTPEDGIDHFIGQLKCGYREKLREGAS